MNISISNRIQFVTTGYSYKKLLAWKIQSSYLTGTQILKLTQTLKYKKSYYICENLI